jgi:O-Antigen ligase
VAAWAVAVLLPFAAIPPLITTPWFSLTDDKLAFLLLVAAWLLLGRRALPTLAESRALLPTGAFILVALVSAGMAATDYADEAARNLARLLAAAFVLLVALRIGQDRSRSRALLWAIAIGGGISALLGIGEAMRLAWFQPLVALFKVAPTRVGGELRVSASFQYATIASMYFEMVAPLAIMLASSARRRSAWVLGSAIAAACTANVVLSLTRAGMLTLAAVLAVILIGAVVRRRAARQSDAKAAAPPKPQTGECPGGAWTRMRERLGVNPKNPFGPQREWRPLIAALGCVVVLAGGVGLLLVHDPVFDLRLVTESDADWYGAVYSAPATLTLQPNKFQTVDVDVRNEGRITWTIDGTHPFALGYRWLTADGNGVLDLPPAEVPLTHAVPPGASIHLQATLDVPQLPAGTYRLDWGMLQRDVLQFYERGWADAETSVTLQGDGAPVASMPAVVPRDDAEAPWVVGRLELWGAAVRLFAAHPLLGVGPDNFRHYYGAELGLEGWDERVQANNLYLEVLADLGIIGFAAFAWVVAGALRGLALGTRDAVAIAVGLALLAFLIHGLLDAFLAFTPTLLLVWMLLGLAQAQKPQVSGR